MNTEIQKYISYIFIILLVGVGAYFAINWLNDSPKSNTGDSVSWGEITFNPQPEVWEGQTFPNSDETQAPVGQTISNIDTSIWKSFKSQKYGFALKYPEYFTLGQFEEAGSDVYVFQNTERKQGIQIYVTPVDETFDITKARILEDIPDMVVRDGQTVELGERSGKGLAFLSDNEAFGGSSREVWFVFKNNLYQISTYASLDTLLQEVLNTWQFN